MLRVAYVSSYTPRECGIATFTEDVTKYIDKLQVLAPSTIAAVNDSEAHYNYPRNVLWQIDQDNLSTYEAAANHINNSDIDLVNVQHEFGLFGGSWGNYLLTFLKRLNKPVVTTMHTTLFPDSKVFHSPESSKDYEDVVKGIAKASSAITVMTKTAARILTEFYNFKKEKIKIIPHGSPIFPKDSHEQAKEALCLKGRTVLSTFGLLSRDKGIQHAISALPEIVKQHPDILYLIIGVTHPQVRLHEGERYRKRLKRWIRHLGLEDNVRFHNRFLTKAELIQYLQATDVYICPYNVKEQLSSGTVTYALVAGKPIVSTPFYYAQELLADERGILCKFKSPRSIMNGINDLLDNPEKKARIEKNAYEYGHSMTWPKVASMYVDLFKEVTN